MKKPVLIAAVVLLVVGVGGVAYASGVSHSNLPSQAAQHPVAAAVVMPALSENSYVPVAPCRLVNTQRAGGVIKSGHSRGFHARGTVLAGQGGHSGGCGVPASAAAVSITVSTFAATGTGTLVAYPGNIPAPTATSVSYRKGSAQSAGTTTKLSQAGGSDFRIRVTRTTQVHVDVTGYYVAPMAAYIDQDGTLDSGTNRVLSSSHPSTGNYLVTFDRDVSSCAFQVTPFAYNYTVAVGPNYGVPDSAHVFIHDQDTNQTPHDDTFFIQAIC